MALVLLFALAARFGLASASASECKYELAAQLPVRYYGRTLGITVEGELNGTPAIFLPDTGASTLLTRFGVEKRRLVSAWTSGQMNGIGGKTKSYSAPITDLRIGPLQARGAGFLRVIDETSLRPEIDAIIGADFLLRTDLELSLSDKQIKLFKAKNCGDTFLAYWDAKAVKVPLLYAAHGTLPMIEVNLDGVSLRALIDTGSYSTVIFKNALAKLGLSVDSAGMIPMGGSGGIGPATARTYRYRFKVFSIEHETIRDPEIRVLERDDKEIDMLLGNDFMRTHRILLAPSQGKVYISYLGGTPFATGGLEDWVMREAEQGNDYAQYRVAISKKPDIEPEGAVWLQKSLEHGNPHALRYRARMLQKAGRTTEALPLFERAIEHDPFDIPGQLELFRARLQSGQIEQAKAKLAATVKELSGNRWPLIVANFYLGNIGFDKLMTEASSVKELAQRRRCEAYRYVGALLAVQGNLEAAKNIEAKRRSECGGNPPKLR